MADIYVATTGNDSTGDGSSGNPYLTLGKAYTIAGVNRVLVKGPGTYSITTTLTPNAGAAGNPFQTVGYKTTIGDLDADSALYSDMPLIQVNNAAVVAFTLSNGFQQIRNLAIDGAGGATKGTNGIVMTANYDVIDHCKVSGFSSSGILENGSQCLVRRCWVTALATGSDRGFFISTSGVLFEECFATANGCVGFQVSSARGIFIRCVSAANTGASSHGFQSGGTYGGTFRHCVAYTNAGSGSDGFFFNSSGDSTDIASVYGCIAYGNARYGLEQTNAGQTWTVFPGDYNAYASNSSGSLLGVQAGAHDVTSTLTGDPFVSPSGSVTSFADLLANFAINNTAGAGAVLRAVGFPAYLDIGALQSQAAAGTSGPVGQQCQ